MNLIKVLILIHSWTAVYYTPGSPVIADYLFKDQQYDEAIIEYKRYVYQYKDSRILDSVYLQIALSYRYLGDIDNSNKFLDLSLHNLSRQSKSPQVRLEKAINKIIESDFDSACFLLYDVVESTKDLEITRQAMYYLMVAGVLDADYTEAKLRYLDYLALEQGDQGGANQSKVMTLLDSASNLEYKDLKKARLFSSFLPGLGQLYCKACAKEVLNAFLLNGSMAFLIAFSIINAQYVDAVIFAILLKLFYSGNRYKTGIICDNYNKNLDQAIQQAILIELSQPSWFRDDAKP
jgi:hypothetical protein